MTNDVSGVLVRAASEGDAAQIAELVAALGYPTKVEAMAQRLQAVLAHPDFVTLLACLGGTVVGLGGAFVHFGIDHDGQFARLTALVVDERWRGRGVGRLLLRELELWARARGALAVTLTSGNHRAAAHDFYRRSDYQQTGVRFIKWLE